MMPRQLTRRPPARQAYPARPGAEWRPAWLLAGMLALVLGAACWQPVPPTALAPVDGSAGAEDTHPAAAAAPAPVAPLVAAAQPARPPKPAPTAAPAPPSAAAKPTLSPAGQALLASVRTDQEATWLKNHTETALRAGPFEQAAAFTTLPQWSSLKEIDSQADWVYVDYAGDGATRQAGPGWVKAADVGAIGRPVIWLSSSQPMPLWSGADPGAKRALDLVAGALMEVVGPDAVQGVRLHVRLPGDGRQVPASLGWVDADGLSRTRPPAASDLPWSYPAGLGAEARLWVPYRTQLDGSAYQEANCGPTTLGMALQAFGQSIAPPDLRAEVLRAEEFPISDDDAGSFIWALARVTQQHGLKTFGLYDGDGSLHHWNLDEIRQSIRQGHPVIVQVRYRNLPRRESSGYEGDHYVIVTGLLGDGFIYNDPIGGTSEREGPGWDRLMSPAELQRAMRASDAPYAFTAFGLGR